MIWKCVDDASLMDEAMALAAKLAKGPTGAFAEIRKAIDISGHNTFAEQLDYERVMQGRMGDHPNFVEGVTAFLQKREAKFKP